MSITRKQKQLAIDSDQFHIFNTFVHTYIHTYIVHVNIEHANI